MFNMNANYLGTDGNGHTPNVSTWLFVLIHRYRKAGKSYIDALATARSFIGLPDAS